ncbi:MAG: M28 family peptidase [Tatlockia sp.]|nr:M28 family peptidase [Tatlockia sp.]
MSTFFSKIVKRTVQIYCIIAFCIIGNTASYATQTCNPIDLLIANSLKQTPIFEDLRLLTDQIGGRPTGSPAMTKAMQWALKTLVNAGLKDAHLEEYTAPINWLAKIERGEYITIGISNNPTSHPVRLAAMPMTTSTPSLGLEAPIFALSTTKKEDIKLHAAQIKDHWLLVPTDLMHTIDELISEDLETPPIFSAAKEAGAVGILWQSNRAGRLLYRHNASFNGELISLPAAIIEREGAETIIRSLKAGETVKFNAILENIIQEKPHNYNVIAEIKGTEKSEEIIILGAHLDSWDLGQGALDNGSNVVMVIEAARQIFWLQHQGFRPKRTIRFMLYSGEELGFYGSWFDVKNHPEILDSIKAVIIYDFGTGRTTGFSLGGRSDMINLVDQALQPINSLGPFSQTIDAFIGTDNFDYLLKGIPTLVSNQDANSYLQSYHAESDTFDKVDLRELKLNTLIATVLTWNFANTDIPFPARQQPVEINQLLESTGLKKEMEINNIWNDFIQHLR